MNRLKGLCAYLSGPIDFAENLGCEWRNNITPVLENMNVQVFNPLRHSFYGTQDLDTEKRPRMAKLLEEGNFEGLRQEVKDLNHWDLRAVDLSSFLVVNYPIPPVTCGTHEEIFQANKQTKPVLLMIGENNRKKMPKWMYGRFPPDHMFESWDELITYLNNINSNQNYEFTSSDDKRWLFFDGKHMQSANTGTVSIDNKRVNQE